jgi:hypothetical protein
MGARGTAALLTALLLSAAVSCRGGGGAPEGSSGLRRLLLVTPDEARGKRFQEFFQEAGIECTVAGYDAATESLILAHDLVIADTPEGPDKAVLEGLRPFKDKIKIFPITERPILGIGFWGTLVLSRHGVALGKVFT